VEIETTQVLLYSKRKRSPVCRNFKSRQCWKVLVVCCNRMTSLAGCSQDTRSFQASHLNDASEPFFSTQFCLHFIGIRRIPCLSGASWVTIPHPSALSPHCCVAHSYLTKGSVQPLSRHPCLPYKGNRVPVPSRAMRHPTGLLWRRPTHSS
jgi:hypothetical protein